MVNMVIAAWIYALVMNRCAYEQETRAGRAHEWEWQ